MKKQRRSVLQTSRPPELSVITHVSIGPNSSLCGGSKQVALERASAFDIDSFDSFGIYDH
jgi:hypothetical protein